MSAFLKKAEQWADENKVSKEQLLEAKIADDMKVLSPNSHHLITDHAN